MRWTRQVPGIMLAAMLAYAAPVPSLAQTTAPPLPAMMVYPTTGTTSWPVWLAQDGGYFAKHGFDMKVMFALHPAGPAAVASGEAFAHNLGLDTALLAAMKGQHLVVISSPLQIGQFVLVGAKSIPDAKALTGKRIAIGRPGDPPYHYALALLNALKVETKGINWIPAGAPQQRALAVRVGTADAAMLTPPDHFILADEGYTVLGRLSDHRSIKTATTYLIRRKALADNPGQVDAFMKAHMEAIKRFYDDKAFTVATLRKYLKAEQSLVERLYDEAHKAQVFERVPYITKSSLDGIVERGKAESPELVGFDFRKALDQSVIDRLIDQGFIEHLYGPSIKPEIERMRAEAFR